MTFLRYDYPELDLTPSSKELRDVTGLVRDWNFRSVIKGLEQDN